MNPNTAQEVINELLSKESKTQELIEASTKNIFDVQTFVNKASEAHGAPVFGIVELAFALASIMKDVESNVPINYRYILLKHAVSLALGALDEDDQKGAGNDDSN